MDRTPRILLVDDNAGDVDLTQEAFRECSVHAHFYIAGDGHEALQFLMREGAFVEAPTPDLIILDLNLPRLSGRDVLRRIKSTPELRRIPIVVLSTSSSAQDIHACYELMANTYIVKPTQWEDLLRVVRTLEQYWFGTATLP
ncbi:MAG: response regulator [Planctomycetes bacterium]|nr:response regulator [Planctomycetota bacterium]